MLSTGLTAEQLAARVHTLGASEIAAVAGLNPWRSAHDVWLSKMELVDEVASVASRVGILIEPILLQLYREDRKCETAHFGTIVHPSRPWMSATPDFFVSGSPRVGEIKCVGWRTALHWTDEEDGVPDYYRVQGEWQCEVTGAEECDFAALLGGTDFRIYRVKRDLELAGMLVESGEKFWRDHVLAKVPPRADGSEGAARMLKKLYPRNTGPMLSADEQVEKLVRRIDELDAAEAERSTLENKLKEAIATADGFQGDGWSVTYRANKNGVRYLRWKRDTTKKEQAA